MAKQKQMDWKEFLKPTLPRLMLFVLIFFVLSYVVFGCTQLGLYSVGSMKGGGGNICTLKNAVNPLVYLVSAFVILIAAILAPLNDMHLVIAIAVIGAAYLISCTALRPAKQQSKLK